MWKILVGFIIFAAAALFIIFKAGDKVDMQGEGVSQNPTEVHTTPVDSASLPIESPAGTTAAAASDVASSSASK